MSAKETELAQAAASNELQTMERLIAEGVSADAKTERGWPALARAATGGHLDALKLLRRHGAKLDATNTHGLTALMCAAYDGKADCWSLGGVLYELLALRRRSPWDFGDVWVTLAVLLTKQAVDRYGLLLRLAT